MKRHRIDAEAEARRQARRVARQRKRAEARELRARLEELRARRTGGVSSPPSSRFSKGAGAWGKGLARNARPCLDGAAEAFGVNAENRSVGGANWYSG